jgi:benzoate 4-monooxygenase
VESLTWQFEVEISIPAYTIQHDDEIWGDPEVFRPERWLESEERRQYLRKYLLTFGKGPRSCVSPRADIRNEHGANILFSVVAWEEVSWKLLDCLTLADLLPSLAYMETQLMLATVLLRYDIQLKSDVLETTEGFVHKVLHLMVKLERR